MAEIYCHSKTLLNALRAVWLEAGKTLFAQVATGGTRRWWRGCWGRGGQRQWRRRPLGVTGCWVVPTLSAGSRRATRRCRHHLSGTTLPGGIDVIRPKGGEAPFGENGLCVLNGWGGCGHLLLVLC